MQKLIHLFTLLFWANLAIGQAPSNAGQRPAVGISGSLSVGGYFYEANGTVNRQAPYGYSINAHSTVNLKGLQIPFSVIFNEQGRRFEQPFNRFGLSPAWKWGKLHLGYRNLSFSPFILAGQTMYMAGLELTPGKLRFAALRGRMNDAVGPDDPNFRSARFKRNALVLKLGGGTEKTHFDFIFMKGKDDLSSLSHVPDSIQNATPAEENSLFGIQWRQPMFKGKLVYKLDAAASTFTENIRFDPIDFSESFPTAHRMRFIIRPNGSTHVSYAGETSLRWQSRGFGLSAVYRRVMPEYRAMGVNYLLTDLEAITLNPSFTLARGKVVLGGSLGLQRNNLDDHRFENTGRTIGSVDLNVNPAPAFGFFAQYANYTVRQQVFKDEFTNDSLLINQINHNVTFSPRFTVFKPNSTHTMLLTLNYQVLDDQNKTTEQFADNDLVNAFLNYIINEPATGWNIRAGTNYFRFKSDLFLNTRMGGSLGATKRFGKSGFSLSGTAAFSLTGQETLGEHKAGTNLTFNGRAEYAFSKKSSLSFQLFYLKNELAGSTFSEVRGQARYNYRF
ncbi:MAG TPA: hypothetical protein ENJ95_08705 [Bacteroidetes bacterium]|nr:hypothetical protein [Bacteroidota bacterium]